MYKFIENKTSTKHIEKKCNIPLQHLNTWKNQHHFFVMIYVYTKKIEDGFKIVFETNMVSDENKIETLLFDERNNNDDDYWLILSHNVKKVWCL